MGRGKRAVVISVGFIEKGTFENTLKDRNHPRGMSGGCSFQTGRIFSANVFALEECSCVHSLHFLTLVILIFVYNSSIHFCFQFTMTNLIAMVCLFSADIFKFVIYFFKLRNEGGVLACLRRVHV